MDLVTKALRAGEGRKFKAYQKRAEAINRFEPEMEALSDAELREEADSLRERARDGESLDDLLPEAFALTREASRRTTGQRHYDVQLIGGMVLHDGAHRRDENRRGQDPDRDPAGLPQHARRRQRPRRHRQRLPRPPRLGMDEADLRRARRQRRRVQDGDDHETRQRKYAGDVTYGTNSEFGFDYLRDNMAGALEHCVQRDHQLRDRGRGRQHPDRRGADAADHLRRPRTGGPDLLHVRPPGQTAGRRAGERETEIARRVHGHLRRRLRLRVRREAQDRRADRARA